MIFKPADIVHVETLLSVHFSSQSGKFIVRDLYAGKLDLRTE